MRRILLIATGGTIASKESGHGLAPAISSTELLGCVPQAADLCQVETLQLMNLDSTNVGPEHWLKISRCIQDHYDQYDGFVITHGTDTMAYTAAALSYLIQRSPKPIVLTGAQKSISLTDTDARKNLLDSLRYAADPGSREVSLVFNGRVILGTRARKERTKSYDAFSCVDYPDIAVIRDGNLIRYLEVPSYGPNDRPTFFHHLEPNILLLTLISGMHGRILDKVMDDYAAVIFQSFGVGGLPGGGSGEFAQAIGRWIRAGKTVLMMTQVPYEGSDMEVYQVGQQVKEHYQVLEAYNMTMEAAVTKLMWILGQTHSPEEIRKLFYYPVQHDLIR